MHAWRHLKSRYNFKLCNEQRNCICRSRKEWQHWHLRSAFDKWVLLLVSSATKVTKKSKATLFSITHELYSLPNKKSKAILISIIYKLYLGLFCSITIMNTEKCYMFHHLLTRYVVLARINAGSKEVADITGVYILGEVKLVMSSRNLQ